MRKIIFTISTFILSLLTMMFSSCGEAEFEYSSAPCYLIIDNSLHQDATLASALTQYSGTYVTITIITKSGARYFSFTNNVGKHTESIFNAYDERRSLILGYNGGLIVGYGNSIDGVLYAFDRECPNCFDPNMLQLKSRPLSVSEDGIATCSYCKRQYNLNIGGFICKGDKGKKMTKYNCPPTKPYGILSVN